MLIANKPIQTYSLNPPVVRRFLLENINSVGFKYPHGQHVAQDLYVVIKQNVYQSSTWFQSRYTIDCNYIAMLSG